MLSWHNVWSMNQNNKISMKNWIWVQYLLFIQVEQICFADDQNSPGSPMTSVQFSVTIQLVQCLIQKIIAYILLKCPTVPNQHHFHSFTSANPILSRLKNSVLSRTFSSSWSLIPTNWYPAKLIHFQCHLLWETFPQHKRLPLPGISSESPQNSTFSKTLYSSLQG